MFYCLSLLTLHRHHQLRMLVVELVRRKKQLRR